MPGSRLALILLGIALGCASRGPTLTGVGVAALPRPGRDPLALHPRPSAPRETPRTHPGTDPLPRHDPHAADPTPGPAQTDVGATATSSAEGAGAGEVWEDPSGRNGDFLAAVRAGTIPVRVLQLGDSHTEGDAWTGALRRALVRARGDGGRGFVPVGGRQEDVVRSLQGPWRVVRSRAGASDGPGGIGLSRALASDPRAILRVSPCAGCEVGTRVTEVTVFYRARPGGGSLRVQVDDGAPRTVSTAQGDAVSIAVEEGPHAVSVRPVGDGPVEVYGVSLDRAGTGARVESAGIVGAQAHHLVAEDEATLTAQLARRGPGLVLLAFGTNESVAARRDPAEYAEALRVLVGRVRAAVPGVTVAIVGPPDTALRSRTPGLGYIPAPRLEAVIEAGRAVARAEGVLYVDLRAMMGGAGAMDGWVAARPALAEPDHVHLTRAGYRRLAEAMAAGLVGPPN